MKPYLEKLPIPNETSWIFFNRRLDNEIPFQWHHHPEYELTLTLNSRGQRYVGDNISSYDDGDLVLLGPNLPHTWHSSQKLNESEPHIALVIWFQLEWVEALTQVLTELSNVKLMLFEATRGFIFSNSVSCKVRSLIENFPYLEPCQRTLKLLELLVILANDTPEPITTPQLSVRNVSSIEQSRIDRVLEYLHSHYRSNVSLVKLAEVARLSPSGLHRLVQRHTQLSVTQYLIRLRIGEACSLLVGTNKPIAFIADSVGYASLANFNRQFRAVKGMTPSVFRKHFKP